MKGEMKMNHNLEMNNENGLEMKPGNELRKNHGNELHITECTYTPSKTEIIDLECKYSPDVITSSARLNYKVNGIKCGTYVEADNIKDAIQEVIPKICFDNLVFEHSYTFKELNLPSPKWENIEGETGEYEYLSTFVNDLNCEIHIPNKQRFIDLIYIKAQQLIIVVIE